MNERLRLSLFFAAAIGIASIFIAGIRNLPRWGEYRGPYGDVIASLAVYERHATDAVNAITYDYRGFDTLGEEFILFSATSGVMLLLRPENGENKKKQGRGQNPQSFRDRATLSEPVRVFATIVFGLSVLFGLYITTHGQLTPGGGFQGGVIIAAAPMLLYIAANTEFFRRVISHPLMEFLEATGAAGYAVIGLIAIAMGTPFLTNVFPLGETGDVFSSGTIAAISVCVGIEVAAAFMLITFEYLREILFREKTKED